MKLRVLSLKHKQEFDRFAHATPHALAAYAFVNQFIWRSCFEIRWTVLKGAFCIFFRDKVGCFMPLPPLGRKDESAVAACFDHMEAINHNRDMSRIENIEEGDTEFFKGLGCGMYKKAEDYIVRQRDIATLKGEAYKHRRSLYNQCVKHHGASLRDYAAGDEKTVRALWGRWESGRAAKHEDRLYRAMLKDSGLAFDVLLRHLSGCGVTAKVATVGGAVVACTSGVPISKGVFCVNFEIT